MNQIKNKNIKNVDIDRYYQEIQNKINKLSKVVFQAF
jgi:hypothetical protein